MYDLRGRKLLITGGGRGLGAAIAQDFAKEGCDLAITYLEDAQTAKETSEKLQMMYGVNVIIIQGDMSKQADCKHVVTEAQKGLGKLDIVVNNGANSKIARFDDVFALSEEDWDKTFALHVKSNLFIFQEVLPIFNSNPDGGVFLIMSSIAGIMQAGSSLAYSVCRAAGLHLMQCLASFSGPKIRVNAVTPGLVRTDRAETLGSEAIETCRGMAKLKRVTTQEEIAMTFVFAAKNEGLTGERIRVDSGMTIA